MTGSRNLSRVFNKRSHRRSWLAIIILLTAGAFAIVFAPKGRLYCDDPYVEEESPDGQWALTVCRRPMLFAMPGSGSDAPGWVVLRDDTRAIRGVSGLSMLQLYGGAVSGNETSWTETRVSRPMVFDLPLVPAHGKIERWWDERLWRLRALVGFVSDGSAE
jgi:hypothetical protein